MTDLTWPSGPGWQLITRQSGQRPRGLKSSRMMKMSLICKFRLQIMKYLIMPMTPEVPRHLFDHLPAFYRVPCRLGLSGIEFKHASICVSRVSISLKDSVELAATRFKSFLKALSFDSHSPPEYGLLGGIESILLHRFQTADTFFMKLECSLNSLWSSVTAHYTWF